MSTVASRKLEVEVVANSNVKKKFDIPEPLGLLEEGEENADNWVMRIINQKDGDKRITWNSENFSSIRAAKKVFDELLATGFVPYVIDQDTGEATKLVMDEFDPFAEEVMMKEEAKPRRREMIMSPEHMLAGG